MRRGSALAFAALLTTTLAHAASDAPDGGETHRLYDRQTDCAVFDTQSFPAQRASWDGPCAHGLASGRGTATFFGRDGGSLTLSAEFRDGIVLDGKAELAWSDGAHYTGAIEGGAPNGQGVLVNAKGDRFDGQWRDGELNGHGSVVWINGDRYEGDWVDGKAEGHGVQIWADGQKYDGAWRNDMPNGQGTVTRKDGTSYAGAFVDGKRQPAPIASNAPAIPPSAAPPVAQPAAPPSDAMAMTTPPPPAQFFDVFAGRTLTAVDGSTLTFAVRDNGLLRTVTAADGSVLRSSFTFLGNGLGSISDGGDPPQVSGVFRVTATGVQVDYADGHSEMLSRAQDGLSIVLKTPSGEKACAAWYPAGHVFSAEERKAAVAAYARRLGVGDGKAAPQSACTAPTAAPVAPHQAAAPTDPHHRSGHKPIHASLAVPTGPNGLTTVPIKVSNVHLIDAAPAADGGDPIAPQTAAADETVASNCLKVDSDGAYWGFRNHCGYAVQFAYCVFRGTDTLTACSSDGAISVPGSVSANGFGALFADDSLGERDVEHDFRWVGCRGGAGEVTAHLDHADPASGRCVRDGRTLAREN